MTRASLQIAVVPTGSGMLSAEGHNPSQLVSSVWALPLSQPKRLLRAPNARDGGKVTQKHRVAELKC